MSTAYRLSFDFGTGPDLQSIEPTRYVYEANLVPAEGKRWLELCPYSGDAPNTQLARALCDGLRVSVLVRAAPGLDWRAVRLPTRRIDGAQFVAGGRALFYRMTNATAEAL